MRKKILLVFHANLRIIILLYYYDHPLLTMNSFANKIIKLHMTATVLDIADNRMENPS